MSPPSTSRRNCNGCGTYLIVSISLSCLIIARHNEVREKLLYLTRWAFTLSSVHSKPLIQQDRTRLERRSVRGVKNTRSCGVTSWSEVYGIVSLNPSLTSDLVTLTRIINIISQWRRSWLSGKKSRRISTVSNAMINRNFSLFVL